MRQFFDFLRKYHHLLLFILLEIASLSLLVRFNRFQGSVWLSGANTSVASVNRWYLDVLSYLNLRKTNQELTLFNTRLQCENEHLREVLLSLKEDSLRKESMILRNLVNYEYIPAKVISNANHTQHNYLVIDRGRKHGVESEMGVISGNGVVGMTYLVGEEYALVIPVTNSKSSISCRIQGQRYFGFLQWQGDDMQHAVVTDIPRHAHVEEGLTIETSGYSSVFPPGIYVGDIEHIENSEDGQSYNLKVKLGTNFSSLREVNVIVTPYKTAIDSLFKKLDDVEE